MKAFALSTFTLPLVLLAAVLCNDACALPDIVVPYLSGRVVDELNLIGAAERSELEVLLKTLEEKSGAQMVVLIPKDLQEYDIESYSIAVVDKWKLGKKGKDQGILWTIAPEQRQMRLEVGYGLEGDLPDVIVKRILDDEVRPFFKQSQFFSGVKAGVFAVARHLRVDLSTTGISSPRVTRGVGRRTPGLGLIFLLVILFLWITRLGSGGGRRGWRSGGGFGGGFGGGGFGGGGFGGGGFGGGGGGFGGGGGSSRW